MTVGRPGSAAPPRSAIASGVAGRAERFGSDASLREDLCRRIAEDTRLAGTAVDVVLDAQALTQSGEVAVPALRDRILEQACGLGIGQIHDSLRVGTGRTPGHR